MSSLTSELVAVMVAFFAIAYGCLLSGGGLEPMVMTLICLATILFTTIVGSILQLGDRLGAVVVLGIMLIV